MKKKNSGRTVWQRHCISPRHGETFWNVENKICGATDIALTPRGRQQADALGRKLRQMALPIDLVLASPLSRAAETARILARAAGLPMQIEPRLTEQNFGVFEGTPRDGADFHAAKAHFVNRFGTGESMLMMSARTYPLLDELRRGDKTCLLVAHNGIARLVHSYFYDMTNEEFAGFWHRQLRAAGISFPVTVFQKRGGRRNRCGVPFCHLSSVVTGPGSGPGMPAAAVPAPGTTSRGSLPGKDESHPAYTAPAAAGRWR